MWGGEYKGCRDKCSTEEIYMRKVLGIRKNCLGFPGGAVVKNLPANAGDTGSSPGLGRSHTPWSN